MYGELYGVEVFPNLQPQTSALLIMISLNSSIQNISLCLDVAYTMTLIMALVAYPSIAFNGSNYPNIVASFTLFISMKWGIIARTIIDYLTMFPPQNAVELSSSP